MPRLYIDGSAVSLLNKGVGRYSYELSRRVIDRLDDTWDVDIVVYTDDLPVQLKELERIRFIRMPKMSDLYHNIIWLPRQIKKQSYDVLLKPMESAGVRYGVPTITVCHDIQELIDAAAGAHPIAYRRFINYVKRYFKSKNLRHSAVVVSNSIFTRDTAAEWYKFDVAKSVIGYCGVDEGFFNRVDEISTGKKRQNLYTSDFILTFATGDSRENYELLPELLSRVRKKGCHSKFIIAGIQKNCDYVHWMETEFRKLKLQRGVDYQYIEFLGEDRINDLVDLYATADFYLELSGHEGFGMQLAEAMATGTTCISSGAGALSEVGAGFDIQFPSFNVEKISGTIVNCYQEKLHQRDNREQIDYVRKHYSWDVVADLVVDNIVQLAH